MKKKIIASCLTAVLALSLLAGCAKKPASETEKTTAGQTASSEKKETTSSAAQSAASKAETEAALSAAAEAVETEAAVSAAAEAVETEAAVSAAEAAADTEAEIVGGYEITESPEAVLDDELKAVFEEAAAQWDGAGGMKPVALLGTQIVSGTNYAFLAQNICDGKVKYLVAIVYQDLKGGVELSKVTDIEVTAENFGAPTENGLAGGWQIAENNYAAPNRTDMEILADAEQGLTDTPSQLIAKLGQQVVSGMNYICLCKTAANEEEPYGKLMMVTVYQDLDGKSEITDSADFNIADFT